MTVPLSCGPREVAVSRPAQTRGPVADLPERIGMCKPIRGLERLQR